MKRNEFIKIGKQLLPQLPDFVVDKNLVFISPVENILRGLSFGGSVDANTFYVSKFFLPLYVPYEFVHDAFGERLRINGNQGWRNDDPNLIKNLIDTIHSEAIPFFNSVCALTGVLNYLKTNIDISGPRVNSHVLEAYAYTLIKFGGYSPARKSLAELKQMLKGDTVPWVMKQRSRAQLIEEKLSQNPEAALAQLEAWKAETVSKLGLEKYVLRTFLTS